MVVRECPRFSAVSTWLCHFATLSEFGTAIPIYTGFIIFVCLVFVFLL